MGSVSKDSGMTLLCCALLAEAQPLAAKLDLRQHESSPYKLFRRKGSSLLLLVSGVGKIALFEALDWLRPRFSIDRAVLAGTACSLNPEIPLGSVYRISELYSDLCASTLSRRGYRLPAVSFLPCTLAEAWLFSVDKPFVQSEFIMPQDSGSLPLLVDMEGWYFVQYWQQYIKKHNIGVIKAVSDYGSDAIPSKAQTRMIMEQGLDLWIDNLARPYTINAEEAL